MEEWKESPVPEYTPEQIEQMEIWRKMDEEEEEQKDKEYQESITNEFGVACYACSVDMCEDRCWEEARRYYYWDRQMKMENVFAELQSVRPAENLSLIHI